MLWGSKVDKVIKAHSEKQQKNRPVDGKNNKEEPLEQDLATIEYEKQVYEINSEIVNDEETEKEKKERLKKLRRTQRIENTKDFFAMLIAAFIVLLPALLVIVAVFLLFIWLFWKAF